MRWRACAGWTLTCSMCARLSITSATTNPTGSSWSSTATQARPGLPVPGQGLGGQRRAFRHGAHPDVPERVARRQLDRLQ